MDIAALDRYIDSRRDALLNAVSQLVRIDSTLGEAKEGMPFGEGPAAALSAFLQISEEWTLPGKSVEGYVGTIDLNQNETALHILGHLDIIDPGDGWTKTEPFIPKLEDGVLYGRGVSDDKGPLVAALLAMQAVKVCGVPLTKNVKLILGTDEETGFRDIHYYYERNPYAPYTLSPDADFPIINIEKGHYQPTFTAVWEKETALPRVTTLQGGPRINMVPSKAEATVLGLTRTCAEKILPTVFTKEEPLVFSLSEEGDALHIFCQGQNAHASTPEEGCNAQTALVAFLAALPLADCSSTAAISALATLFPHGDLAGNALGIAQADELSGALTLAFTRLSLTDTGLTGRFDARTPLCGTEESICTHTEHVMAQYGFTVSGTLDKPHHVPAASSFIQTLARCYEDCTGNKGTCLAIGGGTYVHGIPGGVAFGANMPGFSSNLHGPDERVRLADLLTTAKIYARVIADLCT